MLSVFLLRFAYLNSDVPYLNHLLPIFNGCHRIVLDYGLITSMEWQTVSRTVRIIPLSENHKPGGMLSTFVDTAGAQEVFVVMEVDAEFVRTFECIGLFAITGP